MDSSFYIIGPVIGFIGMMSGGYWGVGCGWIVVPTMLILGCDPIQAVGIGLLQMVPSTILTVSKQASQIGWTKGAPGFSLALPIGAGAAVTSLFGKTINAQLIAVIGDARWLQWMLIVIIAVIICQTLGSRTACYNDEMPLITAAESRIAFVMGLVTGIVSSMLGVGGGLLIRPLLTSGFKVPEYYTSRIVRLLVLVTTVTGGATYLIARGGFDWHVFAISMLVALGGVFGFPLGAKLHTIVYDSGYAQHIHKSFAVVAIAVLANTLLNMYGHAELSRYLMLTIAAGLVLYLTGFTLYAKKNPRTWGRL